jgi:transcriptional regulator with XRE-family HTH domain
MRFRDRLLQLLDERGRTIGQLAAAAGLPVGTVGAWLLDDADTVPPPGPRSRSRLAEALGVDAEVFAGCDDVDCEETEVEAAEEVAEEAAADAGTETAAGAATAGAGDSFRDRLDHYRRSRYKRSIKQLAEQAGLSVAAVNSYLVRGPGQRQPSLPAAVALAKALGVTVSDLAGDSQPPQPEPSPPSPSTAEEIPVAVKTAVAAATSFRDKVRLLLEWRGWTRRQLALCTAIRVTELDALLDDHPFRRSPPFRKVMEVAKALGVPVDLFANCREFRRRRVPTLGELLTRLMREQRMTARELAAVSGVSEATVLGLLDGRSREPSSEVVFGLARALGVPADLLAATADFSDGGSASGPIPHKPPQTSDGVDAAEPDEEVD